MGLEEESYREMTNIARYAIILATFSPILMVSYIMAISLRAIGNKLVHYKYLFSGTITFVTPEMLKNVLKSQGTPNVNEADMSCM